MQDAYLKVHAALLGPTPRLRDEDRALAYLRQTVVNLARSSLRRRLVARKHAPRPMPDAPSAEEGAYAEVERAAVVKALRDLPRRQREAVVLRYYGDLSEAAAAGVMGMQRRGREGVHLARARGLGRGAGGADHLESEREDALRRLLAEAVEPVEPSPGAQARLLARARAQGRKPHRPFLYPVGSRWGSDGAGDRRGDGGAVRPFERRFVGVDQRRIGRRRGAARAPASPEPKADAAAPLLPEPLNSQQLSTVTGTSASAGARYQSNAGPAPAKAALSPSDLDGDGIPDPVTLQAGKLTAELSRDGSQTVDLPSLGPGARVLGVASLRGVASLAPVVFVRLSQVGATSTTFGLGRRWLSRGTRAGRRPRAPDRRSRSRICLRGQRPGHHRRRDALRGLRRRSGCGA